MLHLSTNKLFLKPSTVFSILLKQIHFALKFSKMDRLQKTQKIVLEMAVLASQKFRLENEFSFIIFFLFNAVFNPNVVNFSREVFFIFEFNQNRNLEKIIV